MEGPVDSLSVLVDRLAGRLLSLEAGTEASRPSPSPATSVPAIRAYLAGRAAFRKGLPYDAPAIIARRRSGFHLRAGGAGAGACVELDRRLGGRCRARQAAGAGWPGAARRQRSDIAGCLGRPLPTDPRPAAQMAGGCARVSRPSEIWYGLGDTYYHVGMNGGVDDPLELAAEAFQRGWELDSASASDSLAAARSPIFAEPLAHMVEIAQVKGDTASVRRLVAMGLAADSTNRGGWYLRWHRALALGDSARRAFWADSPADPAGDIPVRFDRSVHRLIGHRTAGLPSRGRLDVPDMEDRQSRSRRPFTGACTSFNRGHPRNAARLLRGNSTDGRELRHARFA